MSRTALYKKPLALCFVSAVALTYLSLVVPGHVTAVCGDLGRPIYCSALAYGFPLPFLVDNQGTSPYGSVARDPLAIVAGVDVLLWSRLGVVVLYWMLVVSTSALAWRRLMRRRKSGRGASA